MQSKKEILIFELDGFVGLLSQKKSVRLVRMCCRIFVQSKLFLFFKSDLLKSCELLIYKWCL
jgi:hypothetical protein